MSGNELIALHGVTRYRHRADGSRFALFEDLDLRVGPSEVVALVGPSGTGKSSLLRLMNRLEDVDGGRISYSGKNLEDLDPLDVRRQVGLVPQKPFMFPGTVRENLVHGFRLRGDPDPSDEEIDDVVRQCAIDPQWLDQPARKLSVGQQQRVSLARTLLNRPRLLLLDEPTGSLDPDTAEVLIANLARVTRERDASLIMVSHDHGLAKKHADRLLNLKNGVLTEESGSGGHGKN